MMPIEVRRRHRLSPEESRALRSGLRGPSISIGEINNPAPEPASVSVRRAMAKAAYLGLDGLGE